MEPFEKSICKILGKDNERTERNAERYREYLLKNLSFPIRATGREDFLWEEPYVFGGWSQAEYKKLKKNNPSYTDTFDIESLGSPDGFDDIVAKLKRLSDGKRFEIGLSWLCCVNENDDAHLLLENYASWHTNC
jgi:hypothetical protein